MHVSWESDLNPFHASEKSPNICNITPAASYCFIVQPPPLIVNPLKKNYFCSLLPTPALLIHTQFIKLFQQMRTEQKCENEFVMKLL